jgi:hypothetical protein
MFAPVAKLASVCTILAIAAQNNWEINVFDFHGAYLNSELDEGENMYMEPPPKHETANLHFHTETKQSIIWVKTRRTQMV